MLHAVIMAGGKGTRFWPLSRKKKPKQFLSFVNNDSLIEATISRIESITTPETRWIVGNVVDQSYLDPLKKWVSPDNILLETVGKNTAPCIGWAALECLKKDPDAIMLVMPADHFIRDKNAFLKTVEAAAEFLKTHDKLLTMGISPTSPHTGYGYIEIEENGRVSPVKQFREKPDFQTALDYLEKGTFYWNSGIFMWRAKKVIELLNKWIPKDMAILQQLNSTNMASLYPKLHSESIDYALLENCPEETVCMKADFAWSDIGSWGALAEFWPADAGGNHVRGNLISLNSHHNLVYSPTKTVALIDMDDHLVVDTPDALLIAPRQSDQRVKDLISLLPDELQ